MQRIVSVVLVLVLASAVFAANASVRRVDGTRHLREAAVSVARTAVPYTPGARQEVLFVQDPALVGIPSYPDPYWTAVMDSLLGVGNYGLWGPTTTYEENGPDLATMQPYMLVIWNTYDSWVPGSPDLTATDQANIESYLGGGGKMWLIGQDVLYSGVPYAWMLTNFDLADAVEDYSGAPGVDPYPVIGMEELAGFGFSYLVDWGSDVYPDNLIPTGDAHWVIEDVNYPGNYPSILSNDYMTSFWTVDGRNPDPWDDWQDIVEIMFGLFGVTGINEKPSHRTVTRLELTIAPDPLVRSTIIRYALDHSGDVAIQVFNTLGQQVVTLVNGHQEAGEYMVTWNGNDVRGARVANGVYFVKLACDESVLTHKLTVIR